ncbi:MAG TPA: cytochrome c biogenesis protein CcdA [Chloroflexota bacterium]|jgi:cytochrome c-type biogenesis protein|nr:cytochrome c biogenesis protein CcdA [Chloroflexota bacterium]
MNVVELGLAGLAGMLSFLSPCCLPLVPMYLGYLSGIAGRSGGLPVLQPAGRASAAVGARPSQWLVLLHATCFVAGFSSIFVVLGASASVLGAFLGEHRLALRHIAGIVIVLLGLHTAGVWRFSWLYRDRRMRVDPTVGAGVARSAALGAAFGAGWSPCIGPMLGSIIFLAGNASTLGQGVLLLLAYSVGLGIPFLLAALFVQGFARQARRVQRFFSIINVVAGGLLVTMGLLVYTGTLLRLATLFPGVI